MSYESVQTWSLRQFSGILDPGADGIPATLWSHTGPDAGNLDLNSDLYPDGSRVVIHQNNNISGTLNVTNSGGGSMFVGPLSLFVTGQSLNILVGRAESYTLIKIANGNWQVTSAMI